MEDTAHRLDYNLILCNTDNNKPRLLASLKVLKEKQIDGLIFTSEPIYPDYNELFQQLQIPVVLAATHSLEFEIPSVKVNDEQAGFEATEYLIRNGHRRIGMIAGSMMDPVTAVPRLQGSCGHCAPTISRPIMRPAYKTATTALRTVMKHGQAAAKISGSHGCLCVER